MIKMLTPVPLALLALFFANGASALHVRSPTSPVTFHDGVWMSGLQEHHQRYLFSLIPENQYVENTHQNRSDSVHPDFFHHFEGLRLSMMRKTGSSTARQLLKRVSPPMNIRPPNSPWPHTLLENGEAAGEGSMTRMFRIHSVRNPFSYYVSMWLFLRYQLVNQGIESSHGMSKCLNEHPGALRNVCEKRHPDPCNLHEDKQRFHAFLRELINRDTSIISTRMWATTRVERDGDQELCPATMEDSKIASVNADLHNLYSMGAMNSGDVSCWLHTENLGEELAGCFRMYVKLQGGAAATKLDLSAITDEYFGGYRTNAFGMKEGESFCDFYDAASIALVMKQDGDLVRMFNYSSCEIDGARR